MRADEKIYPLTGDCELCRTKEEQGVAVLVCGACYEPRRGVRLSHDFLKKMATARCLTRRFGNPAGLNGLRIEAHPFDPSERHFRKKW